MKMNDAIVMPARSMRLEIGCGVKRPERRSFIGLDRYPLPGVDVVCDLDSGGALPFRSDQFDIVYASHVLEHVQDLQGTMEEVDRVCRPGGQLCILAPSGNSTLNRANPSHRHDFNEHPPRFWTAERTTCVPLGEYR